MIDTTKPSFAKLLVHILFLMLPTLAILFLAIDNITGTLSFLQRDVYTEITVMAAAMLASFAIHYFRVRAWVTFIPLAIGVFLISKTIDKYAVGEFDSFYLSIKFQHLSSLFVVSWLVGYCLAKFRYFPHILAAICMSVAVVMIASMENFEIAKALKWSLPVLVYAIYIIYTKEFLADLNNLTLKRFGGLVLRLSLLVGLLFLAFQLTTYLLSGKIKAYEKNIASARSKEGKGKGSSAGSKDKLLKENEDGTFDINEIAKLDKQQNTATGNSMKELLFVTYLDNYLSGTDNVPMPYYYVSFYLSKYDTQREQFVRDKNPPMNDNFNPMPQQMPMLISVTDSSVLKTVENLKARTTKEVLIYTDKLNPNHFTAPATAYAVEPIPVDPDFKDKYKFAYRAKSYASYLNEAFFVYNHPHPIIQRFNNERHNVLKSVKGYKGMDPKFMAYYTEMPKTSLHDSIATLAKQITAGATTPIDKVVKVRDYFKQKGPDGKTVFKYTLQVMKPTEPNIPNQRMLSNFLFKTKKGYCTYYSAASLFMLRSLGVPVRFTAGFLIEDRSAGKNQGWYTVYGSQAHAWIQVYFPEYGWLDFDTTIPDDAEQQNAPKPDGTPPLTIPKIYFSGFGKVLTLDTAQKTLTLAMSDMNFRNREYSFTNAPTVLMDLKKATIYNKKDKVKIKDIKVGMELSAVVYSNIFKNLKLPEDYGSGKAFVAAMVSPLPIDDVHLKIKPATKPKEKETIQKANAFPWQKLSIIFIIILLSALALFLILFPISIYWYYKIRIANAKTDEQKAYYIHMLALYVFNQLGYYRGNKTTSFYARNIIDPIYNIGYSDFANVYLKMKYSGQKLNNIDMITINEFYPRFIVNTMSNVSFWNKIKMFSNYVMLQKFFTLPEETE